MPSQLGLLCCGYNRSVSCNTGYIAEQDLLTLDSFLFLFSALFQLWLARHHRREKRYGPSPANNYGKGSGVRFFQRKKGERSAHAAAAKDAEAGAFTSNGVHGTNGHNTDGVTGATDGTYVGNKYETPLTEPHHSGVPTAGGYHTAPTGTAVNPYGYDKTHATPGTNF
jgi:hypothetical protein